jgi:hypothetical protein
MSRWFERSARGKSGPRRLRREVGSYASPSDSPAALETVAPSTATQAAGARESRCDLCLRNLLKSGACVPGECPPICRRCVRLVD